MKVGPCPPNMVGGGKGNFPLGPTPRAWRLGYHSFFIQFPSAAGTFLPRS